MNRRYICMVVVACVLSGVLIVFLANELPTTGNLLKSAPRTTEVALRYFDRLDADHDGVVDEYELWSVAFSDEYDFRDMVVLRKMYHNRHRVGHIIGTGWRRTSERSSTMPVGGGLFMPSQVTEHSELVYRYGISRRDLETYEDRLRESLNK